MVFQRDELKNMNKILFKKWKKKESACEIQRFDIESGSLKCNDIYTEIILVRSNPSHLKLGAKYYSGLQIYIV